MKNLKTVPLLLATIAFLPIQLFAASDDSAIGDNFYIGANVGAGYIPSANFQLSSWTKALPPTGVANSSDPVFNPMISGNSITNKGTYDLVGGIAVGYMMSNHIQFEAEGGMSMSPKLKVKSTTLKPVLATAITSASQTPLTSSVASINDNEMAKATVFYGMASGYFNIDMGTSFMPYIGVGAGFGHYKVTFSDNAFNKDFNLQADYTTTTTGTPPVTTTHYFSQPLKDVVNEDVTKNGLILQGSAGVNMMITDAVMIGAGYRLLTSAGDLELETDSGSNSSGATSTATNKAKYHYMRHLGVISAKFLM